MAIKTLILKNSRSTTIMKLQMLLLWVSKYNLQHISVSLNSRRVLEAREAFHINVKRGCTKNGISITVRFSITAVVSEIVSGLARETGKD